MTPTNSATNGVAGCAYTICGTSTCSRRPALSTATRSATASASDWSCVTNSVVMPSASCTRRISSRSCTRTRASSAESGSSSSSTDGCTASARASATRCCCPPDIWCGYDPPRVPQPDDAPAAPRHASGAPAAADLPHPKPERDVLRRRHRREQRVGLEHHAGVALGRGHPRDVLAADEHLPGRGRVEAREQPQRRGLAAAGRAEQRQQLAGLQLEVEPVEGVRGAEAAPDPAELDGRARHDTLLRPPANDTSSSNSQVSTRLASVSATDTPAWL